MPVRQNVAQAQKQKIIKITKEKIRVMENISTYYSPSQMIEAWKFLSDEKRRTDEMHLDHLNHSELEDELITHFKQVIEMEDLCIKNGAEKLVQELQVKWPEVNWKSYLTEREETKSPKEAFGGWKNEQATVRAAFYAYVDAVKNIQIGEADKYTWNLYLDNKSKFVCEDLLQPFLEGDGMIIKGDEFFKTGDWSYEGMHSWCLGDNDMIAIKSIDDMFRDCFRGTPDIPKSMPTEADDLKEWQEFESKLSGYCGQKEKYASSFNDEF